MITDLESVIKYCEEVAEKKEITAKSNLIEIDKIKADGILRLYDADEYESCMKCANEHRQLAEWLRELQRYRFEISECKAILDNPTPDVTENDRKRAMYVLQTFPDVRGDER